MLTPAFHFQILESFFDVFNEQSRSLIDELTAILSAKKMNDTVDVYDIMTQCALDIICGKWFIMRSVHSTVKLGIKLSVSYLESEKIAVHFEIFKLLVIFISW